MEYFIERNIKSIIQGFYKTKLNSLWRLIKTNNGKKNYYMDFLLCSRDKFVIPIRTKNKKLTKGNIITSNLYTFINPNKINYFNECFYPDYVRECKRVKKLIIYMTNTMYLGLWLKM